MSILQNRSRELTHDRLADDLDILFNPYDFNRRMEVLIDEFLKDYDLANRLVLDAGCATGRTTQLLTQRGAATVSLDLGFRLVTYAYQRCRTTQPLVGDVLHLPFKDNAFDVVLSSEVIEHTPHPLAAVSEMYRVLKPGGHFVLSTPGRLWQIPVRLASRLKLRPYDGLENFVKPAELRSTLAHLGATIVEHRGFHLLPFQLTFLHSFVRYMDRYGKPLLPFMINQAIHCIKPAL